MSGIAFKTEVVIVYAAGKSQTNKVQSHVAFEIVMVNVDYKSVGWLASEVRG